MPANLEGLAKTIGWVEIGREDDFINLEYNRRINDYESVRHI